MLWAFAILGGHFASGLARSDLRPKLFLKLDGSLVLFRGTRQENASLKQAL
jgi:hypothetical protein